MKTLIKLSLILTLVLVSVTSCKKYEDGPAFSLRTKKARITGEWKIESVTFKGSDVTAATTAILGANYMLEIEKDGKYKIVGNFPDDGTWKFGEDKDDIYTTSSKAGSVEQSFRILRLMNKELWLRQTASNGDVSIFKYKQ